MLAKRCLIGLQKGVNMTSKGHLLQGKRASFRVQLSINKNLRKKKSLHNRQFVDTILTPEQQSELSKIASESSANASKTEMGKVVANYLEAVVKPTYLDLAEKSDNLYRLVL